MFYAHSKKGETKENWQTLKEHLLQTAELATKYADKFHAKELGYVVGLMHDIGKYSKEFQERLEGKCNKVDHSTASMQEIFIQYSKYKALAKIMAYVTSGHHSGLPDAGTENLEGSLECRKNKLVKEYCAYKKEITLPNLDCVKLPLKKTKDIAFSYYFFIKMLYSCLVDADYLDTENFIREEKGRGQYASIHELLNSFNRYMEEKIFSVDKTKVNKYRQAILNNCIIKAQSGQGMFTLTVPTGGGKTLSSMAFALNHAAKNGMERIIYVIPYTSIIEQNAEVFRNIFGDDNVLEHHSNFQFEDDEYKQDTSERLKLASENWDMPIIVTTNVQFFESLFSNKSSKSRKLHNLSKSVIILDEAQMLPIKYLKVCLLTLCELVNNYHSSIVLCTATQPNLNTNNLLPENTKLEEIVDSPQLLYEQFKRTNIISIGETDDDKLADKLVEHYQVLCIVNRREHARLLYERLKDTGKTFHLSTKMYPLHRRKVLKEIKTRLLKGLECRVIATQLVEAGVDVDFPVVYRSIAGIDSIAQAAGRCNREGKRDCSEVFVFIPLEKHGQPPREIEINVSEAKSIFRHYEDPLSIEAINKYFELLYDIRNTDQKDILRSIKERSRLLDFPFAEISREFKIIENDTLAIIIPCNDECKSIIRQLEYAPYTYKLIRQLQPYTVNVYKNEVKKLLENGAIYPVDKEKIFFAITNMAKFYDDNTGIISDNDDLLKSLLFI